MWLAAASLLYFISYYGSKGFLKPNCLCLAVFSEIRWMQIMRHELGERQYVCTLLIVIVICYIAQINKCWFKYCTFFLLAITLCYEYQFSFKLKVGVIIIITNILQLDVCLKKSSLTLQSFLECVTGRGSKPWLLKIALTVVQSLS